MDAALTADKIAHLFDDYGAGGHAWFYWQRDLKESLPDIMQTFAHPPAAPKRWDYKSIDATYSVWGWAVKIDRPALEFSELRGVNKGGFALSGSGSGAVTTGAVYKPRAIYVADYKSATGTSRRRMHADSDGRLHLTVPLGPGNELQEYSPEANATNGTQVYTTTVKVTRERRR
jgi:hypothetical protein